MMQFFLSITQLLGFLHSAFKADFLEKPARRPYITISVKK